MIAFFMIYKRCGGVKLSRVYHTLEPWFADDSRVLILGTIPSVRSRELGCYYGHPQNRFWKTLASLFEEPIPYGAEACRAFAFRHRLALWDVLASCDIKGSQDASIENEQPNDLMRILEKSPIELIITTGTRSKTLYDCYWKGKIDLPVAMLPSTSPANRRWAPDDVLIESYRIIRDTVK